MEESSNRKLGEIQNVETHDGDKEVSGEFKTEAEVESVSVIVVNGDPEPVIENLDGDDSYEAELNENSTQKVDSREVEEKIIVIDSVVDSVEPGISSPSEGVVEVLVEQVEAPDDAAELESMVIEDNITKSLDETNRDSKLIEETIMPSSDANDGSSPDITEVVSKAIEEIPSASSDKKGIEQIPFSSPDDNKCEVPPATADVVSKAIEGTNFPALEQNPEGSSGTADLESKEKVHESSREAENAGSVDNHPEIPTSTENQPVTSLSQRNIQPTSWRSCCGLLEFLRRSDR